MKKVEIDEDEFRRLYESGATYDEIGEAFGVGKTTVGNTVYRLGLSPRRKRGRQALVDVEAFTRDWEMDMPQREMAVLHRIGLRTVQETANRLGLRRRYLKQDARGPDASPTVLAHGEWENRGGVQVWVPAS